MLSYLPGSDTEAVPKRATNPVIEEESSVDFGGQEERKTCEASSLSKVARIHPSPFPYVHRRKTCCRLGQMKKSKNSRKE